ncbi:unnamed protein product, partial [Musa banksii]
CGGALQYIFLQCTMRRFFLFLPELAGRQPWTGSQCDCRCMLHVIARPKYQSGRCSSVFNT